MTNKETEQVLNKIIGVYSNFLMGRNIRTVFDAWNETVKEQDYNKVTKKLNAWIAENEKPPLPCNLITVDWRKCYEHQFND